jgi:AcrR family transcriptional regulator
MRASPPGRPPLDRDRIVRAALELVDADGLEAASMRRLARALGVTPMALYNHVGGRGDLLDGIADLVAREMAPVGGGEGWQARIAGWAHGMRAAYLAHPNAVAVVQRTQATTPALTAPARAVVASLEGARFTPDEARAGWAAVVALVNGHVAYQLSGHMAAGEPVDFDAAFALATDALLTGLAARLPSSPPRLGEHEVGPDQDAA